jgi:hypothetical protein
MRRHILSIITLGAVAIAGCLPPSAVSLPDQTDTPRPDRSILGGEWEYEEGTTVILRLDENGDGVYPWKEGRFETMQLKDRTWTGKWYQKENDREGAFLVKLSRDYAEGEGTWWYIRIGADHTPIEKGGTFRLSRKASLTKLGRTPPAP